MTRHPFLFATGIENSYPTIGTGRRIDQMEKCGHYDRWDEDFGLVPELGLNALRYGPAYYRTHPAPDRFDWTSADDPMHRLKELGIEVIADLCHFGVPDWLGNFQNDDFPVHFARYASAFARRYPWIRYFTPVNEIFVCAHFSALKGWWNECAQDERSFVRALRNMCLAHELAVEAILRERPDAIFVQAESVEHFHATCDISQREASRMNSVKFLSLDLTLGRELDPGMPDFLQRNGVTTDELAFFRERRAPDRRWIGLDYYPTCEYHVAKTGALTTNWSGHGFRRLAAEYYTRYRKPLYHCETNRVTPYAVEWLHEQWADVQALRASGIPVTGFTWFSLTDQIDWQHVLRVELNELHPVGLFDLDRRIRPVGEAYRTLIRRERIREEAGGRFPGLDPAEDTELETAVDVLEAAEERASA